ncbi:hypothetical protein EVAR_102570_1 [Eumeta japonica]|uniref:Uncharacterized protein n=1 Tax=Eumeta variegata TaxID=151549 RepID=A0A4C1SWE2_EUMVA|nr:hypothetical protein EVAR_102570_1 [Eumeta japonica]
MSTVSEQRLVYDVAPQRYFHSLMAEYVPRRAIITEQETKLSPFPHIIYNVGGKAMMWPTWLQQLASSTSTLLLSLSIYVIGRYKYKSVASAVAFHPVSESSTPPPSVHSPLRQISSSTQGSCELLISLALRVSMSGSDHLLSDGLHTRFLLKNSVQKKKEGLPKLLTRNRIFGSGRSGSPEVSLNTTAEADTSRLYGESSTKKISLRDQNKSPQNKKVCCTQTKKVIFFCVDKLEDQVADLYINTEVNLEINKAITIKGGGEHRFPEKTRLIGPGRQRNSGREDGTSLTAAAAAPLGVLLLY